MAMDYYRDYSGMIGGSLKRVLKGEYGITEWLLRESHGITNGLIAKGLLRGYSRSITRLLNDY